MVVAPRLSSTGSVVAAHGLSCSTAVWDLPRPGIEPMSLALQGGFSVTEPPGSSQAKVLFQRVLQAEVCPPPNS